MPLQNPDDALLVQFREFAQKNEAKSIAEGRLICDDIVVVEIRAPGNKTVAGIYPALSMSHWQDDPLTGEQRPITYAERFSRQYQQYKALQVQTKSGTPLTEAKFLTEAKRAELRALNIYTVEALAGIDGQELKNVGPGGRELKNLAIQFIEEGRRKAPDLQMMAELEALRARNAVLEEDAEAARARLAAAASTASTASSASSEDEFEGMSSEQLREYIEEKTGHPPIGSLARKTLVRMASAVKSEGAPAR